MLEVSPCNLLTVGTVRDVEQAAGDGQRADVLGGPDSRVEAASAHLVHQNPLLAHVHHAARGGPAGDDLGDDRAEGVHVGGRAVLGPIDVPQLGRHVDASAHGLARVDRAEHAVRGVREAEVRPAEPQAASREGHERVAALDVPVEDAMRVDRGESLRALEGGISRSSPVRRSSWIARYSVVSMRGITLPKRPPGLPCPASST